VQQSSIWDANQSASFAAGAIVSYCPQYESPSSDEMQQTFQNALSDLQAIQGDVQSIQDDLQAIPGHQ
jgi:peptidoglycan hydrolase CwlO-like protein